MCPISVHTCYLNLISLSLFIFFLSLIVHFFERKNKNKNIFENSGFKLNVLQKLSLARMLKIMYMYHVISFPSNGQEDKLQNCSHLEKYFPLCQQNFFPESYSSAASRRYTQMIIKIFQNHTLINNGHCDLSRKKYNKFHTHFFISSCRSEAKTKDVPALCTLNAL